MCGEFHARAIIEFVTRCNDEKVEGILVHCYAGISRSAVRSRSRYLNVMDSRSRLNMPSTTSTFTPRY